MPSKSAGRPQARLIDVFDNELTRLSNEQKSNANGFKPGVGSNPIFYSNNRKSGRDIEGDHVDDTFQSVIDRLEALNSELQSFDQETDQRIASLLQTLKQHIKVALEGVCTCIEQVEDHVKRLRNAEGWASNDYISNPKTETEFMQIDHQTHLLPPSTRTELQDHTDDPSVKAANVVIAPVHNYNSEVAGRENTEMEETVDAAATVIPEASGRASGTSPEARITNGRGVRVFNPGSSTYAPMSFSTLPRRSNRPQKALFTCSAGSSAKYRNSTPSNAISITNKIDSSTSSSISPFASGSTNISKSSQLSHLNSLSETAADFDIEDASLGAESRYPSLEEFEEESVKKPTMTPSMQTRQPLPLEPPYNHFRNSATSIRSGPILETSEALLERSVNSSNSSSLENQNGSLTRTSKAPVSDATNVCNANPVSANWMVRTDESRSEQYPLTAMPSHEVSLDEQSPPSLRRTTVFADAQATDHVDAATVAGVQVCVEQLQRLGFDSIGQGGLSRLVVYAQAAGGNLWEAIELMDEEKRAYDEIGNTQSLL